MIRQCFILALVVATPAAASSYVSFPLHEQRFASAKRCARELERLLTTFTAAPGEGREAKRDGDTIVLTTTTWSGSRTQVDSYFCRQRTLTGVRGIGLSIDLPTVPAPR